MAATKIEKIKVLLTGEQIQKRVRELAKQISADYKGNQPMLVSILKGSIVFLSDLIRNLDITCMIDFVAISSYFGETESSGVVRQLLDLRENPVNKDLLIVEDIVDTGTTLDYLRKNLLTRNPKSLKICVLLDKREKRQIDVPIDYTGFVIPDKFVVGYGLDYQEKYRNLPYVGVLKNITQR
ncbi:MAG: hypoxanthine phosphoribosyltransferase [Elusimicrobiota bacterium]|nr:hypoxanthine phosphoribosyltransferase [Elusimicrobiota bacterium]